MAESYNFITFFINIKIKVINSTITLKETIILHQQTRMNRSNQVITGAAKFDEICRY